MAQASTSAAFTADKVMAGTVLALGMVAEMEMVATAALIATAAAINPTGQASTFKPTGAGATEPLPILVIRVPLSRGAFFIGGHV